MKKRLPLVIENCFQCPYFKEGDTTLMGYKDYSFCQYGRFHFYEKGEKFPVNCPLADWQEITLPG